jgi:hypothetical protein
VILLRPAPRFHLALLASHAALRTLSKFRHSAAVNVEDLSQTLNVSPLLYTQTVRLHFFRNVTPRRCVMMMMMEAQRSLLPP